LLFGTQFTPSIFKIIEKTQNPEPTAAVQTGATALETGGTESGTIRKIVWQGAIQVWKHYPVFGTGVETFAYSYYLYRPAAHNMTSEWDFIYNKAHNEYLNFMANTGTVGIFTYLTMVGFSIYLMSKKLLRQSEGEDNPDFLMPSAFIAGFISILVTNFFGFSVVPIQLLFFLYPAFCIILASEDVSEKEQKIYLTSNQKSLNWILIFIGSALVFVICRYWYADYLYATGSGYNKINRQDLGQKYLNQAIKLEPNQSIYYAELAKSYTNLAIAYSQAKESTAAAQLTEVAIDDSIKAVNLSPANLNLKRMEFGVFVMLSTLDPNYLLDAKDILETAILQAPTDAKLHYNLGLIYSRIGQNDLALQTLKETVDLKPDYKDARLAYAILLIDAKRNSEAKAQLEYILTNLDPKDSISKQYLESIK
jgi:tetratricopeptide (TPR) repeat protein